MPEIGTSGSMIGIADPTERWRPCSWLVKEPPSAYGDAWPVVAHGVGDNTAKVADAEDGGPQGHMSLGRHLPQGRLSWLGEVPFGTEDNNAARPIGRLRRWRPRVTMEPPPAVRAHAWKAPSARRSYSDGIATDACDAQLPQELT